MARKRPKPDTKPVSGMTRLLKALEADSIPRFVHPYSRVLLSEQASHDAVRHALSDTNHPDREAIITAVLDEMKKGQPQAAQKG